MEGKSAFENRIRSLLIHMPSDQCHSQYPLPFSVEVELHLLLDSEYLWQKYWNCTRIKVYIKSRLWDYNEPSGLFVCFWQALFKVYRVYPQTIWGLEQWTEQKL